VALTILQGLILLGCKNIDVPPETREKKIYYAPPVEKTYSLEAPAAAPRRKILVVDNDVTLTELARAILETNGYEVDVAFDGVGGIKKILGNDYSAILCDMVMPNLAGDMFYIAVERVKPHLCKRFLFMTGHRGDRKIDEFIRKVRGLILWKPFQSHILMESIKAIEDKGGQS
jgi:CheY-like chemotaxis protein